MYAVIKTGGKQYKVAKDDVIRVEKLPGEAGQAIEFAEVLMLGGEAGATVGSPLVDGATERYGRVDVLINSAGHGPKAKRPVPEHDHCSV